MCVNVNVCECAVIYECPEPSYASVIRGYLHAMNGERDPRNLLIAFRIHSRISQAFTSVCDNQLIEVRHLNHIFNLIG